MKIPSKHTISILVVSYLFLCGFMLFCAISLQSHPAGDYDEGVYLTTFKLVQHGFPLYQMTYHSQPPGFFLLTYPLFLLGGSTLEAGRIAIFFYTLVGLLAILWLAHELDSLGFAFMAVGVLYVMPVYQREILNFHSTAVTPTFSILALAAGLRYNKASQRRWIFFAALMVAVAALTKADVSALPALLFIMLRPVISKARSVKHFVLSAAMFSAVFVFILTAFTLPFGISNVINSAFGLRMDVAAVSSAGWSGFWDYIGGQMEIIVLLLSTIVVVCLAIYRHRSIMWHLAALSIWVFTIAAILMVYRPLWLHHFALLIIPTAVLFSYALYSLTKGSRFAPVLRVATALLLLAVCYGRLDYALRTPAGIANEVQLKGIELVQANTQPGDYIVSDDGIVTALSGRLTPPMLSDLSLVRVWSGSLTPEDFAKTLEVYQPKMVLTLAGKLQFLERFDEIMDQYHFTLISRTDADQRIYLQSR